MAELVRFYQEELPETLRLYDSGNPVCVYYHLSRRDTLLSVIEEIRLRLLQERGGDLFFLDAGCGDGMYVQKAGAGFSRAYGVDISAPKLEAARKRLPPPHNTFLEASLDSIPLLSDHISLLLCSEVMEHLPDPPAMLRELYRITSPGGYLVLSTPVHVSPMAAALHNLGLRRLRAARLPKPDQHGHLWAFSPGHVHQLIQGTGFHLVSTQTVPTLTFKGLAHILRRGQRALRVVKAMDQAIANVRIFAGAGAFIIVVAQKPPAAEDRS